MRGTREPNKYRNQQCPYCHLYFHGQGLHGHIMFAHKQRFPQLQRSEDRAVVELVRLKMHADLAEEAAISTERRGEITNDIMDKAFQLFMTDYIFNRGIFTKKQL